MSKNKKIPKLPIGFSDISGIDFEIKRKVIKTLEDNFINFGFAPLEQSIFEISENIGSFIADDPENPMADGYTFEDSKKQLLIVTI